MLALVFSQVDSLVERMFTLVAFERSRRWVASLLLTDVSCKNNDVATTLTHTLISQDVNHFSSNVIKILTQIRILHLLLQTARIVGSFVVTLSFALHGRHRVARDDKREHGRVGGTGRVPRDRLRRAAQRDGQGRARRDDQRALRLR